MAKPPFSTVWDRIVQQAGHPFETKTGLPFVYSVRGNTLISSRAKQMLDKAEFERAYQMVPFEGPGDINKMIRGPAYVWAILHDKRISQGQW